MIRAWAILAVLVPLLMPGMPGPACAQDMVSGPVFDLSTLDWRYRLGDEPEWKSPDYDHSGWARVALPGPLPETPAWDTAGTFWLRAYVEPSQRPEGDAAIHLGRIHDYDQTFVDGKLVGETGRIAGSFWDLIGIGSASLSRVYPLPPSAGGRSAIAIRVQSLSFAPGLTDGPLLAGPAIAMTGRARGEDLLLWLRDGVWLSFFLLGFAISSVAVMGDMRDERNKWLPAFIGCFALAVAPHTTIAAQFGLDRFLPSYAYELIPYFILGVLHLHASTGVAMADWQKMAMGGYVAWVVAMQWDWPITFFTAAANVQVIIMAVVLLTAIWRCAAARQRRMRASRWTWLGIGAVFLSLLTLVGLQSYIPAALDPMNFGSVAMMLCFLLAMAEHQRWDREALHRMTGEILSTREQERERIARELHDGINQRIAVTRMRLERLRDRRGDPGDRTLDAPIEELSETGREVSTLVEGLGPIFLQDSDFFDALLHAGERWGRLSETRVDVTTAGELRPPQPVQQQIYRVIQEAVHNAMRHGAAKSVSIDADFRSSPIRVSVSDDGAGFDAEATAAGVGLTAMKERARLCGGDLRITSAPGKGTTVQLDVRLK